MASFGSKSLKLLRFTSTSALSSKSKYASGWIRNQHTQVSFNAEPLDFVPDDLAPGDSKVVEKDTALRSALSKLQGEFGKENMLSLQRFFGARRAPVISTGSLKLDQALGIGGLPKGRIVEIYGKESSGKTTLALHVIKEAQELGGYCAFIDAEHALDPSLAESIGIDIDNLLISQPDSAENLLSVVDTLTKSGAVSVIVVDSVAALIPHCDVESSSCVPQIDRHSALMQQALRKIHFSLCNSDTLIIFINQIRYKLSKVEGSTFVKAEEATSGGNALKFYAAIRLRISRKALMKTGDKTTGLDIIVQVVKNKLAPSMEKAELSILFGKGICRVAETLELACEHGVIENEGNRYVIKGMIFHCKEDAHRYLAEHRETLDDVLTTLRSHLIQNRLL